MKLNFALLLWFAFLLFGCAGEEWDIYTNEKFSMNYPAGDIQPTQGDEVFKVTQLGCQITVNKLTNQPSFSALVDYMKTQVYNGEEGILITSEKISESEAEFGIKADVDDEHYRGKVKMIECGDDTVYLVMVGCGDTWYNAEKANRIIDSIQCK